MAIQKNCSSCFAPFTCGDTPEAACWCNQYPAIFKLDITKDCLCTSCLHLATVQKIEVYVAQIAATGIENNSAASALKPSTGLLLGIDYYIENGFWVFTAWHHLKRGTCCKSGCRHCPFGFKKKQV